LNAQSVSRRQRGASALESYGLLGERALRAVATEPAALVLAILFPIAFLAINIEALAGASALRDFPTDNIASFAIGLTFLQGALFAGVMFATDLARDIENGFINRIALAPVSAGTVLLSRMLAVVAFALVQFACFATAGAISGASLIGGPVELLALIGLAVLFNLAVAVVGFQLALQSGSGEMTQALFPIFFVLLLVSSALMPRGLMDAAWFQTAADLNPVSYMVEAIRSLYVTGWDVSALLTGACLALAITVAGSLFSLIRLRALLARH
jgi:ABC-2 type transport system permease protein